MTERGEPKRPTRASLRAERYSDPLLPALREFNARLDVGGAPAEYRFGTAPERDGTARRALGRPVRHDELLAVEGDAVRGAIMLQHQIFQVGGTLQPAVNLQLPLSEGIIDKRYAHVAMWLVRTVLRDHPNAFAVGMGGLDQPFPRLLAALRWDVRPVPFLVRVHRVGAVLRGVPAMRRGRLRRAAALVAAVTGSGWLGVRMWERWAARDEARPVPVPRSAPAIRAERVRRWGTWADVLWREVGPTRSLSAVRDSAVLELLYPADEERYLCFAVRVEERTVGWMVLLSTQMRGNQHFGDLRVGTILDCWALPGYEHSVACLARRQLEEEGVDVSVCNHAAATWVTAFRRSGYISARSNFLLATSPALTAAAYDGDDTARARVHLTRGDGDGRINL